MPMIVVSLLNNVQKLQKMLVSQNEMETVLFLDKSMDFVQIHVSLWEMQGNVPQPCGYVKMSLNEIRCNEGELEDWFDWIPFQTLPQKVDSESFDKIYYHQVYYEENGFSFLIYE